MGDLADTGTRLPRVIEEQVELLGFDLVDLKLGGTPQREVVTVLIDLPDSSPGHGISVDQCAAASRVIERTLEDSGLVGSRYRLEVSSPGLERPVRWPRHWRRYAGQEVAVRSPRWRGKRRLTIASVPNDQTVTLAADDGTELTIPLDEISEANLVVDWDALVKKKRK